MDDKLNALNKLIEAVEAGTSDRQGLLHMIDKAMPQDNRGCMAMAHQAYHGSLDAALALHEALLPVCGWKTQKLLCNDYYTADVWGEYAYSESTGTAPTPARAWLIAVLKAYREITQ